MLGTQESSYETAEHLKGPQDGHESTPRNLTKLFLSTQWLQWVYGTLLSKHCDVGIFSRMTLT